MMIIVAAGTANLLFGLVGIQLGANETSSATSRHHVEIRVSIDTVLVLAVSNRLSIVVHIAHHAFLSIVGSKLVFVLHELILRGRRATTAIRHRRRVSAVDLHWSCLARAFAARSILPSS